MSFQHQHTWFQNEYSASCLTLELWWQKDKFYSRYGNDKYSGSQPNFKHISSSSEIINTTKSWIECKPRKMWRKCHSLPWRSVATSSCQGGCWDISWRGNWKSAPGRKNPTRKNMMIFGEVDAYTCIDTHTDTQTRLNRHLELTSGGKQSSACLRRTENPPWVLVSEAVSVLQNEWTLHLSGSGRGGSGLVTSLCWYTKGNKRSRQNNQK